MSDTSKTARPRRTPAQKAQEAYDLAKRKYDRKVEQVNAAKAEVERVEADLHGLQADVDFYGSHPLLRSTTSNPSQKD